MVDPFLLAHTAGPLLFDIGSRLTPISIRDQMLRGQMLVDRAYESGLIGEDRPLIVIGAGAAGATAAVRAASRRVQTLLVERGPAPFGRQLTCATRWIDPTQYDWPLLHWSAGTCPPWHPPLLPLAWRSDYADALAREWGDALKLYQVRYRRYLRVACDSAIDGFAHLPGESPELGKLEFSLRRGSRQRTVNFGMAVVSPGPGVEDCGVAGNGSTYSGPRFWDNDVFERFDLGLSGASKRILVSGGGDGALQDFIRIVTGYRSARDLYEVVRGAVGPDHLQDMERAIQDAEDQAQRAWAWGSRSYHDHPVHLRLQGAHEAAVRSVVERSAWVDITRTLDGRTRDRHVLTVHLAHGCSHFSHCYALNRFLTLLLGVYLRDRRRYEPFLPGTALDRVWGITHARCSAPSSCLGLPHRVVFQPRGCPGGFSAIVDDHEFDVIVVRHGLRVEPTVTPVPLGGRRHLLPYHDS